MSSSDEYTPKGRELLLCLLLAIPYQLLGALYTSTIWRWYVEPLGAPHLGVLSVFALVNIWHLNRANRSRGFRPEGPIYTLALQCSQESAIFGFVALVRWLAR